MFCKSVKAPDEYGTSVDVPTKRTLYPVTTGTSVVAIKYADGVMVAADMVGSYGSLARYQNISRMMKAGDSTLLAATGDIADYQEMKSILDKKHISESLEDDGFKLTPTGIFSWLTRVLYYRRTKFNPFWNIFIVAGWDEDNSKPFLGYVDKIGCAYTDDTLTTGIGHYLARPGLREAFAANPKMTEDEAKKAIERALKILYYRDCRAFNRYQIGTVTAEGVSISEPLKLETNWEVAQYVKGYQ